MPPSSVKVQDTFWAPRLETNRRVTIPHNLRELKAQGSLGGFALLAGRTGEKYHGYMFGDSDVYKTLEGIVYSLRDHPDRALAARLEQLIGAIAAAQAADGYLMPHIQLTEPAYRHFSDETTRTCESYCMGHLIESAVAHYEATGRKTYLDVAVKLADLLVRVHGGGREEADFRASRDRTGAGAALSGNRRAEVPGTGPLVCPECPVALGPGLVGWHTVPGRQDCPGPRRGVDRFFYPNPLACTAGSQYQRVPWFGCPCCPTNVVRFLPQIAGYVYAVRGDDLFVNLFTSGQGRINVAGQTVTLRQETGYPWDGRVKITVEPQRAAEFTVRVRLPGWSQGKPVPSDLYRYQSPLPAKPSLKVNEQAVSTDADNGFSQIVAFGRPATRSNWNCRCRSAGCSPTRP